MWNSIRHIWRHNSISSTNSSSKHHRQLRLQQHQHLPILLLASSTLPSPLHLLQRQFQHQQSNNSHLYNWSHNQTLVDSQCILFRAHQLQQWFHCSFHRMLFPCNSLVGPLRQVPHKGMLLVPSQWPTTISRSPLQPSPAITPKLMWMLQETLFQLGTRWSWRIPQQLAIWNLLPSHNSLTAEWLISLHLGYTPQTVIPLEAKIKVKLVRYQGQEWSDLT